MAEARAAYEKWQRARAATLTSENLYTDKSFAQFDRFKEIGKDQELAMRQRAQEAREREIERRRQEAEDERRRAPRKILVCGDARGEVEKLFGTAEAQHRKVGPFDALLCVGRFLPEGDAVTADVSTYFRGEKQASLPTYFIDAGATLLQAAPQGKQFGDSIWFLGAYGVREICDLRVAFLSGSYDPVVYNNMDADFVGASYTSRAVNGLIRLVSEDRHQRGIDVLLTCGWPSGLEQAVRDSGSQPPLPEVCAPPLAELCLRLEPRYHVFGQGDLFHQQAPFQVALRKHFCRCIGLGMVGSTSKQRKWMHALQFSPIAFMKREELRLPPVNVAPCPFVATEAADAACSRDMKAAVAPGGEAVEDSEPAAKRPRISDESVADLRAQALAALVEGASTYGLLARQLREGVRLSCPAIGTEKVRKSLSMTLAVSAGTLDAAHQAEEETKTPKDEASASPQAGTEDAVTMQRRQAAERWLKRNPKKGVIRYTFEIHGPIGIRFSKDIPPWILEVKDGSLAARKAPKVPLGGIVLAVNGYQLEGENCISDDEVAKLMKSRPVSLDVQWPADQGTPTVDRA